MKICIKADKGRNTEKKEKGDQARESGKKSEEDEAASEHQTSLELLCVPLEDLRHVIDICTSKEQENKCFASCLYDSVLTGWLGNVFRCCDHCPVPCTE